MIPAGGAGFKIGRRKLHSRIHRCRGPAALPSLREAEGVLAREKDRYPHRTGNALGY
jgi:hypothetical protein